MIRKTFTLFLAIVMAFGVSMLLSQRLRAEEKKPKTELAKNMEQLDDAMKKLRRLLRKKESNAQSLEVVAQAEQLALTCKGLVPSRATTMPSAQQPAFNAEYRKQMSALLDSFCNMETALLNDDNAKAQEIFKQLKTQEENGHDQFMPADDDSAGK